MADAICLRETELEFAGCRGEDVIFPSANPVNYHDMIRDSASCPPVELDGKLFLPEAAGRAATAAVAIVPGSLGIGPNHIAHAEALIDEGLAVLLVDPFTQRAVQSTIADQTQYSFAGSAFDVLAAVRWLAAHPRIDSTRIAAQGHSRGGSAVLMAAMEPLAAAVLGSDGPRLAGAYAVYPWCGHQFRSPQAGSTAIRAIIGDQDQWCSVQQAQAQVQALQLAGADASFRLVAGAAHSFDRLEDVHTLPDAMVAPAAPTTYLDEAGCLVDPWTGAADPERTDRDTFLDAARAGFAQQGASIGGVDDQPEIFRSDMLEFHRRVLRG